MNRYALIVGISQYQSRSLPPLSKPAASAEAVARLLETYGNFQEVRRLPANWLSADRAEVGRTPLTEAMLSAEIKRLLNEQAIGGEVLIYFSGHGFVVSDNLGGSEAYLAASDTQIGVADGQVIWQQNGISLRSLAKQFAQAKFSSLVMLLDCCHSGLLIESGVVQQALANASSGDYVLIAACRGFEKAYEGEAETPHSNFTSALLAGLERSQAAENGQISSDRLVDHLSRSLKGSGQEPIRLGFGQPIAIVTYPPSPTAPTTTSFNWANPYVGLAAFETEQADYFFGRDAEIRSLLERLDPLQRPPRRFLAVIGPSGSGKSSLVKAGLVPALAQDKLPDSSQWQVEAMKPGANPLRVLREAIAKYTDAQPHLLLIDQFEELFTLCQSEEEQREFLKLLNQQVTEPDRQARVVITMRADFLDRCARYQESAELINQSQPTTFIVTPLTDDKLAAQLGQAIVQPATQHGVEFQPGLAARMSSDVRNQLGAMPLLQYALTELWKHCIPDGTAEPCLTWAGYEAIGGVRGALQRRADSLYNGMTESSRKLLKAVVMELVQVGEAGEVSRRRAQRGELWSLGERSQVDRLLDQLTSERFLMVDGETVEVAHEALLSEAPKIREWIEENRDNLRQRDRFERDCREWQEQGRSIGYLLNPIKLAAVQRWIENTNPSLSTVESEFVGESVGECDREAQAQLEQERRLREAAEARELVEIEKKLEAEARAEAEADRAQEARARVKAERRGKWSLIGGGLVVGVLLIGIGLLKIQAKDREIQLAKSAAINSLTDSSKASFDANKQLEALISGVRALELLKHTDKKEIPPLLQPIFSNVREYDRLTGHQKEVLDLAVSSNDRYVASAGYDSQLGIWLSQGYFKKFPKAIESVDFSSDETIAFVSSDGTVRLMDTQGNIKKELKYDSPSQNSFLTKVRFSPSGKLLAVAGGDGNIKIWNLSNYSYRVLKGHSSDVYSVSFSNDSQRLASASKDRTVKLWNLKDDSVIETFRGHTGTVFDVSFDLSGQTIASASKDGTVMLWSARQGGFMVAKLTDNLDEVNGVSFSHNGRMIASAGKDNTVRVWDSKSKRLLLTLKGHTDAVNSVKFSFDDQTLLSASDDKTIRVWKLRQISTSSDIDVVIRDSCSWLKQYLSRNINKGSRMDNSTCKQTTSTLQ